MEPRPDLTDDEIKRICHPLVQPAAQIRYLRGLGLHVARKPGGRPLVARSEWERALVGGRVSGESLVRQPDRDALIAQLGKRKHHGAQAQK